jgi:hypothetical protein
MPFRTKKLTPIDTSSLQKLGQGVINLSKFTEDEFSQVAKALSATDPQNILYSAPPKPRRGTIAYADGTHWNPGQGEGPYWYNGTTWTPAFEAPGTGPATVAPLPDATTAVVGTSLLYARQDHVHPLISSPIHASLGADVAISNNTAYFDGPSIAQGTTGTWWVSGKVTVFDTAGANSFDAKLWDGTTVIDSAYVTCSAANYGMPIALSGFIVGPAGNLKISVKSITSSTGKMVFNTSSNSKDSTISAFRIA